MHFSSRLGSGLVLEINQNGMQISTRTAERVCRTVFTAPPIPTSMFGPVRRTAATTRTTGTSTVRTRIGTTTTATTATT